MLVLKHIQMVACLMNFWFCHVLSLQSVIEIKHISVLYCQQRLVHLVLLHRGFLCCQLHKEYCTPLRSAPFNQCVVSTSFGDMHINLGCKPRQSSDSDVFIQFFFHVFYPLDNRLTQGKQAGEEGGGRKAA